MRFRPLVIAIIGSVLLSGPAARVAHAQWSLLAPGDRVAPTGQGRYAMLVMANPIPGTEAEFNDWYLNTHMGDLVQLAGWTGAQRFRIVSSLNPRPTRQGYAHGYLIIWDQEGADPVAINGLAGPAINGGKSRRGAGYDYIGGTSGGGIFQAVRALPIDQQTWEFTYWTPISPYITKDDFVR